MSLMGEALGQAVGLAAVCVASTAGTILPHIKE
jgi:hypothetical protein